MKEVNITIEMVEALSTRLDMACEAVYRASQGVEFPAKSETLPRLFNDAITVLYDAEAGRSAPATKREWSLEVNNLKRAVTAYNESNFTSEAEESIRLRQLVFAVTALRDDIVKVIKDLVPLLKMVYPVDNDKVEDIVQALDEFDPILRDLHEDIRVLNSVINSLGTGAESTELQAY